MIPKDQGGGGYTQETKAQFRSGKGKKQILRFAQNDNLFGTTERFLVACSGQQDVVDQAGGAHDGGDGYQRGAG
jgi:hypothetical protein